MGGDGEMGETQEIGRSRFSCSNLEDQPFRLKLWDFDKMVKKRGFSQSCGEAAANCHEGTRRFTWEAGLTLQFPCRSLLASFNELQLVRGVLTQQAWTSPQDLSFPPLHLLGLARALSSWLARKIQPIRTASPPWLLTSLGQFFSALTLETEPCSLLACSPLGQNILASGSSLPLT